MLEHIIMMMNEFYVMLKQCVFWFHSLFNRFETYGDVMLFMYLQDPKRKKRRIYCNNLEPHFYVEKYNRIENLNLA